MQRAFGDALEVAETIPSPFLAALALIGKDRTLIPSSAGDPAYLARLERAEAELGDEYPAIRSRLLARCAGQLAWGNSERASEAASRAMSLVDFDEAPIDAIVEAMSLFSAAVLKPNQRPEAIQGYQRIVERARAENDRSVELRARTYVAVNAAMIGDADVVDGEAEQMLALTAELREPGARSQVARFLAHRALWEGRLEEARTHAWEARELTRKFTFDEGRDQLFQVQLWGQRRLQGRLAETIETLQAGVKAYPNAPIWRGLIACAYAESGDPELAKQVFEDTRRDDFAVVKGTVINYAETLALLSEACIASEHVEGAEALEPRLLPYDGMHIQVPQTVSAGSAARCLANLSTLRGRFDDAEPRFERAIALDRKMRAHGWLPRTQCDYARMLLTRNDVGDREKALGLLDEAMAMSTELGLKAWLDRCLETKLAAQGVQSGSTDPFTSIDVLVQSLGNRQPNLTMHGASDGTLALLFSDVEGFTAMIERLGDLRAREVIRDHNKIVRTEVAVHGGREVEIQGDAFFLVFPDPRSALHCAVSLQRAFVAYTESNPDPLRVRIGLHVGETLREGERFFGRSVNLAARVAAQANGGEILASGNLVARVSDPAPARYGESRRVALKGIADAQEIHRVEWR
jgi:class 3 adenylate cyclase